MKTRLLLLFMFLIAAGLYSQSGYLLYSKISDEKQSYKFDFSSYSYQINNKETAVFPISNSSIQFLNLPGEPQLPWYVATILLPPETDVNSLDVYLIKPKYDVSKNSVSIEVLPTPPYTTWEDDKTIVNWPENKSIVNGRDIEIYSLPRFWPEKKAKKVSTALLRNYKLVKVAFPLVRYQPVNGVIEKLSIVDLEIRYSKTASTKSTELQYDQIGKNRIQKLALNYNQIENKYPVVNTKSTNNTTYAIITTSNIANTSTNLNDFIQHKQNYGFDVELITESEYGGGTGDVAVENIRLWLQNNYLTHNIEYVLLIGNPHPSDGDIPMKMLWPRSNSTSYRESPSDYYYADLNGNWDLDGDGLFGESDDFGSGGVDYSAEVLVGRIPYYGNMNDLDHILQKTISYETNNQNTHWQYNLLTPMKPLDDNTPGYHLGEALVNDCAKPNAWGSHRIYDEDYGLNPTPETTPTTYQSVTNVWKNNLFGLVVWLTHGSSSLASSIMSTSYATQLNDQYPSFTFHGSCNNSYPEVDYNLAYTLLKNGAIATIGATRVSWYYPGQTYFNRSSSITGIAYEYSYRIINNQMTVGEALFSIKEDLAPGIWMNMTVFNIYGDPSLKIVPNSNRAPIVYAGNDIQTIWPNNSINIVGEVLDDEWEGTELVIEWKKYSGSGDISFSNSELPNTVATFSEPGIYKLILSANDGEFSDSDTIVVIIEDPFFSNFEHFGDTTKYTKLNGYRWEIFNDGNEKRFGINTSNYNGSSGKLGEYAIIEDSIYSNFLFQAQIKSTENLAENKLADYCIVFGYKNENNYCYAMINKRGGNSELFVVENGIRRSITNTSESLITDNNFHNIVLERIDNHVTLKIDGQIKLEAIDDTFKQKGYVGIGSFNDAAWFDNINVINKDLIFSPIEHYGNVSNHTQYYRNRWEVINENGDNKYLINTTDYTHQVGIRLGEYSIANDSIFQDFSLQVEAKSLENLAQNDKADYAIVFGFVDNSNYYYMLFINKTYSTALYQVSDSKRTEIMKANIPVGITDNEFHKIVINRRSQFVEIYLDNVRIIDVIDNRMNIAGQIGIGSFNDAASFDNLSCTSSVTGPRIKNGIIEAEHMLLTGYEIELENSHVSPSNDALIKLSGNTGEAQFAMDVDSWEYYDLKVGYIDECDGISKFELIKTQYWGEEQIISWTGDFYTGTGGEMIEKDTLIENLSVAPDNNYKLRGTKENGAWARFDYVDLQLVPQINAGKIEAEKMVLHGYDVYSDLEGVSNDAFIKTNSEGFAKFILKQPTGFFNIKVSYIDEHDGIATFRLKVDNWNEQTVIAEWQGTYISNTGSKIHKELEIQNQFIYGSSRIILEGIAHDGEKAIFDYIEITPVPVPEYSINKIEAEDMLLSGFEKKLPFLGNASNDTIISTQKTGKAVFKFTGEPGVYCAKINYFDKANGNASFKLELGELSYAETHLEWSSPDATPESPWIKKQAVIEEIYVYSDDWEPYDVFHLSSTRNLDDYGAIDCLELVPYPRVETGKNEAEDLLLLGFEKEKPNFGDASNDTVVKASVPAKVRCKFNGNYALYNIRIGYWVSPAGNTNYRFTTGSKYYIHSDIEWINSGNGNWQYLDTILYNIPLYNGMIMSFEGSGKNTDIILDYIDIQSFVIPEIGHGISEAEHAYKHFYNAVDANDNTASNDTIVNTPNNGRIYYKFNDSQNGYFDIIVHYTDDYPGNAQYTIGVGSIFYANEEHWTGNYPGSYGSTAYATYTMENIYLYDGAIIYINGASDLDDLAGIDYIEIVESTTATSINEPLITVNNNRKVSGFEENIENTIIAYPNPGTIVNFIVSPDLIGAEMILHDLNGKVLEYNIVSQKEMQLDLSIYPNGIYLLNVQKGDKKILQKVIKE